MAILKLETIMNESIWVAKMQGYRTSGTYAEIGHLSDDEDCRDFDLSAKQPEHLKEFFDEYFAYGNEHGFITIPDYYNDIYVKAHKRVWTEDEIKNLVQTNDKVLYGALKKLYACQTADEQSIGETTEHNGVGFNGIDGTFLSSCAEFLIRKDFLTDKQKVAVRKKMVKYTKQLTKLANA